MTALAELRQRPEVRRALDIVRPGDIITFTHVDGVLQSLNRQISNTLTLSVARSDDGFAVNYLENPLETEIVRAPRADPLVAVRRRPGRRHVGRDDHDAGQPDLRLGHRLRARHPRRRRVQRAVRAEVPGRRLRQRRPRARRRVRQPGQAAPRGVVPVAGRRSARLLHARGQGHAQGVPARAARLHAHEFGVQSQPPASDQRQGARAQGRRLRRADRHADLGRGRRPHQVRGPQGRLRQRGDRRPRQGHRHAVRPHVALRQVGARRPRASSRATSSVTSAPPARRPARTCTTNTRSRACTRIRPRSRCRAPRSRRPTWRSSASRARPRWRSWS